MRLRRVGPKYSFSLTRSCFSLVRLEGCSSSLRLIRYLSAASGKVSRANDCELADSFPSFAWASFFLASVFASVLLAVSVEILKRWPLTLKSAHQTAVLYPGARRLTCLYSFILSPQSALQARP